MGSNNTIVIVGNKSHLINQISSKLVLLRDLDKVESIDTLNAIPFLKEQMPNVILLHCENNDRGRINLIKEIKSEPLLKNSPILLIGDMLSRDMLLDAFDAGISDVIHMPVLEYELLMRVIWCISRNELNTQTESRSKFLAKLGIIQEETGFYTQVHCDEFLVNEVDYSIKYQQNACLMLLSPDDKGQAYNKEFWDILKSSIRMNDSVAMSGDGKFYIFLPKTKLNGVYSFFERMNTNFEGKGSISAGVIEINEKPFMEIKECLEKALEKASENGKSLLVATENYSEDPTAETVKLTKETVLRLGNWVETPEAQGYDGEWKEEAAKPQDEHSERLFKQTFKKKCKLVAEPVFKKYIGMLVEKYPQIDIESIVEQSHAKLVLKYGSITSSFYISHSGGPQVRIEWQQVLYDEVRNSNNFLLDMMELNFQKLSEILDGFTGEFANLVNSIHQ